jgi:hypothetical protein
VAQLIARSVWDREVEGLSPFTPTIEKIRLHVGFFLWIEMHAAQFFDFFVKRKIVEGLVERERKPVLARVPFERKSEVQRSAVLSEDVAIA